MSSKKETTANSADKKSSGIKSTTGQRGGYRPGAGRKPGSKNKKSAELIAEIEATGETPLEFMLRVMRDKAKPWADRMEMAKAAAPYVHAKLSSVEMNAHVTNHESALDELDG
jgi:hypothetical protein